MSHDSESKETKCPKCGRSGCVEHKGGGRWFCHACQLKFTPNTTLLKIRMDGREMVDKEVGYDHPYFVDFYVIGNPRQALRKQIALAAVYHKPNGDEWWFGSPEYEPIKAMATVEERLAFLQAEVDKNAEVLLKAVNQAGAKA